MHIIASKWRTLLLLQVAITIHVAYCSSTATSPGGNGNATATQTTLSESGIVGLDASQSISSSGRKLLHVRGAKSDDGTIIDDDDVNYDDDDNNEELGENSSKENNSKNHTKIVTELDDPNQTNTNVQRNTLRTTTKTKTNTATKNKPSSFSKTIHSATETTASTKPAAFSAAATNNKTGKEIFQQALKRGIGGGIPGAIAGAVQVLSLMWLRTVINYQYRYGSTFHQALTTLYTTGGIPRLYSGISFALIQAPLSRFVSTAANDGVTVLLHNLSYTQHWGPGREVVVAALVVGLFRMLLMPIDTCKTVLQIESGKGFQRLMSNVKKGHVHLLYSGAVANALSSFIGHYPWFYTYNVLTRNEWVKNFVRSENLRNALIGLVSSIVSDTAANFMRVIKTTKQALGSTRGGVDDGIVGSGGRGVSYTEAISVILAVDGWRGLFGRGLKTRIIGNALQSILFTVIWRGLAKQWKGKNDDNSTSDGVPFEAEKSKRNNHYNTEDDELVETE